ncbi:MAG: tRNA pseudouridine(38-40) synthase TruA [Acidobacteria bacterium]|nr:tRNA pseudouridine(38-40) synthase TruA [Acidobacteriota bacterium]
MPAHARTLRLVLAYDGADFAGWQRQTGQRTVQGELEDVLSRIEGAKVHVAAAGRTDAGVHAAAQVASITLTVAIAPDRLVRACNASLPADLRVVAAEEMPDRFHARIHARGKTYRYYIWHAATGQPSLRRAAWHVPQRLSLAAMQEAAALFVGEHDFSAFQAQGSDVKTTVRRIWTCFVEPAPALPPWCAAPADRGRLLMVEVAGSGFLRHQVRAMAGTLVLVGKGRLSVADVRRALAGGARADAGPTAPACGLHLWKVHYEG